jgi:hypothetical protein
MLYFFFFGDVFTFNIYRIVKKFYWNRTTQLRRWSHFSLCHCASASTVILCVCPYGQMLPALTCKYLVVLVFCLQKPIFINKVNWNIVVLFWYFSNSSLPPGKSKSESERNWDRIQRLLPRNLFLGRNPSFN